MIYSLFLDESGIESYNDKQQDYVVAGIIIDREYCRTTIMPEIDKLKTTYFGDKNIIFHFTEMKNKLNSFKCLNRKQKRIDFWNDYFSLLEGFDFKIVGAIVNKTEMGSRYFYPQAAKRVAMPLLYENYVHFLKNHDSIGKVFIENVNGQENERIQVQYHLLMANGTARLSREGFIKHIRGLKFHEKGENIIGLQIVDTIAFGINTSTENRLTGKSPDLARLWNIINNKLYDGNIGNTDRYGLQKLP